jgi:homogentisate 1,2-dioxygenase
VSYDHPDPSIYCVLASPSSVPGTANMEFGCFPPRWSVAEHTFRPPPFHRNVASEFLGLISGQYIGKADTFVPGSASLHNCMSGHGPDAEAYERGSSANLEPQFLTNTMVFLFETQLPIRPTKWALETDLLEREYYKHWQGLKKHFAAESVG